MSSLIYVLKKSDYRFVPLGSAISFCGQYTATQLFVLVVSLLISLGGLGVQEGVFSLLMQRLRFNIDIASAGGLLSLVPLFLASFFGSSFH